MALRRTAQLLRSALSPGGGEGPTLRIRKSRLEELIRCEGQAMAAQGQTGITIGMMQESGKGRPDLARLLQSAQFLHRELPIRYAVRWRELELAPAWMQTKELRQVIDMYKKTFAQLRMCVSPSTSADVDTFEATLLGIKQRHAKMVPMMGAAVHNLEGKGLLRIPEHAKYLNTMLHQFFTARIGSELLVGQYLALRMDLRRQEEGGKPRDGWVGLIQQDCVIARVVQDAALLVAQLCTAEHGRAPEIRLRGDMQATFTYFPELLNYMVTQLVRNSVHATMVTCRDAAALPPVEVVISGGNEPDSLVGIMIQDQGGGIPLRHLRSVWDFTFSAASLDERAEVLRILLDDENEGEDQHESEAQQVNGNAATAVAAATPKPLAEHRRITYRQRRFLKPGLGFGLPLARLYAKYYGGSLHVRSVEGWGTLTYLHFTRQDTVENIATTRLHTLKSADPLGAISRAKRR